MSAMTAVPRRWAGVAPGRVPIEGLVRAVAISAAVELAVLRLFTRTAIHIPDVSALETPYDVLAGAGRYAYYLSALLLVVLLPMLAAVLWQRSSPARAGAAIAVTAFALAAVAARAGLAGPLVTGATATGAAVALAGILASSGRPGLAAWPLGAALAICGIAVALEHAQVESGPGPARLLATAEWPLLAGLVALPVALRPAWSRAAVVVGVVVALIAVALFLGNGSTTRILLLWNVGVAGVLPGVAYSFAAGCIAATLVGLARSGRGTEAAALALVLAGGVGLQNTYQSALVVVGLAVLALVHYPSVTGGARPA